MFDLQAITGASQASRAAEAASFAKSVCEKSGGRTIWCGVGAGAKVDGRNASVNVEIVSRRNMRGNGFLV
jgi:hypothetical protein